MKITTTPALKIGDKITISGLAYGLQYGRSGMTWGCKLGQETVMTITEVSPSGEASFIPQPGPSVTAKKAARNQPPKRYGPPRRGRW